MAGLDDGHFRRLLAGDAAGADAGKRQAGEGEEGTPAAQLLTGRYGQIPGPPDLARRRHAVPRHERPGYAAAGGVGRRVALGGGGATSGSAERQACNSKVHACDFGPIAPELERESGWKDVPCQLLAKGLVTFPRQNRGYGTKVTNPPNVQTLCSRPAGTVSLAPQQDLME